jgi:hypothetical protein
MVTFLTGHSIVNLSTTPYLKILTNRSFPYFMNINKLSPQKTFEKLLIFNVSIGPSFDTFTILQAWCNFCLYVSMLQSLCFYKHATTFMFMQACYNLCIFMISTPYYNTCISSFLQAQQSFTQIACNGCTQFKFSKKGNKQHR